MMSKRPLLPPSWLQHPHLFYEDDCPSCRADREHERKWRRLRRWQIVGLIGAGISMAANAWELLWHFLKK